MPELPEVENVIRSLREHLAGRVIDSVAVSTPSIVAWEDLDERLRGRRVLSLGRRGKYIILRLDKGFVLIHLRMTGRLLYNGLPDAHTHAAFHLAGGDRLLYKDVRKFGRILFFEEEEGVQGYLDKRLGLEPGLMSYVEFRNRIRKKRGGVKKVLLDQGVVAGIGNIYADEILFHSRIHPEARVETLGDVRLKRLYASIRWILERATELGGSTIRDYVNSNGESGGFQKDHQVYGRGGGDCLRCGRKLRKIKVAGRTTVYCPACQKKR